MIDFCLLGSSVALVSTALLQAMSNCLREVISFWKTAPFLLFHNCQQHGAMNMLCCCWGTVLTLMLELMSYAAKPFCGTWTPKKCSVVWTTDCAKFCSLRAVKQQMFRGLNHRLCILGCPMFPEKICSALNFSFDNQPHEHLYPRWHCVLPNKTSSAWTSTSATPNSQQIQL